MKNLYLIYLILMLSSPILAQDFTSKNNTLGNWKTDGTWVGEAAPNNNGEVNSSVHIYGKVTLEDNLILDNNNQSEVYDTLWVRGNLTINSGSSLVVKEGGVLIIDGILYIEEGSFDNSGLTVLFDHYEAYEGEFKNVGSSNELYALYKRRNYQDGGLYDSDRIGTWDEFETNHNTLFNQLANGTLPIKLLSFTGTAQTNTIQLDWITAWEENFDFFTVERAGNDLQFKAIGTLKGSGNTAAEVPYSFTDQNPMQGQAFYRLKATDFDGSIEYHKIISVYFDGFPVTETKVYPNPVTNHSLKLETSQASVSEVSLLDLSGRVVFSQKIQMGINEISLPEMIKPGAYILVVFGNQEKQYQQKIMVL